MKENKERIKQIVAEREIPYLLHFTRLDNLKSILDNGLYSRDCVDECYSQALINDHSRADRRRNTISVSVAHPNDRMFYKLKQDTQTTDQDWSVVILNKRVLWELDCLFFQSNAAGGSMSCIDEAQASSFESFDSMFYDEVGSENRSEQVLKPYDPTDVQAEVLVKNHIPTDFILGAVVADRKQHKQLTKAFPDLKIFFKKPNKTVFASRQYRRRYNGN